MAINVKGGDFEIVPAGSCQGVVVGVHNLGIQKQSYKGQEKKVRQFVLLFELNKMMQKGENKGKPFVFAQRYSFSIGDNANFTKHFKTWFGRNFTEDEKKDGFDVEKLLNKNAFITFVHTESNGKTYSNIGAITPVPSEIPSMRKTIESPYYPDWVKEVQKKAEPVEQTLDDFIDGKPEPDFYEDTGFNSNPVTPPEQPMKDDVPF